MSRRWIMTPAIPFAPGMGQNRQVLNRRKPRLPEAWGRWWIPGCTNEKAAPPRPCTPDVDAAGKMLDGLSTLRLDFC